MYKISLYSEDGLWMREWKANWFQWIGDYRGFEFGVSKKKEDESEDEDEEKKIRIKGGIVIIEDMKSDG